MEKDNELLEKYVRFQEKLECWKGKKEDEYVACLLFEEELKSIGEHMPEIHEMYLEKWNASIRPKKKDIRFKWKEKLQLLSPEDPIIAGTNAKKYYSPETREEMVIQVPKRPCLGSKLKQNQEMPTMRDQPKVHDISKVCPLPKKQFSTEPEVQIQEEPELEKQLQTEKRNGFMTAGERLAKDKKTTRKRTGGGGSNNTGGGYHPLKKKDHPQSTTENDDQDEVDPRLKGCDAQLIERIENEIIDNGEKITFDDIAGLHHAKKCVKELVTFPIARPDIFKNLRKVPRGLLLFGPPGTGKTLIGKALAHQAKATFFSISASSLTSKWIGEGEKLVRTLFAVAAVHQPSVVFIDEIDSLLTQRSSEENEASRRMKTEFLVQLDGAGTNSDDVILVVGATNRPQELDEAARRRLIKRLYIPLPSAEARLDLVERLLKPMKCTLSPDDLEHIVAKSEGYSGADIKALCTEAAMGPIRQYTDEEILHVLEENVRPIQRCDFDHALQSVRSSVAQKDLQAYLDWNQEFGSVQMDSDDKFL